MQMPKIIKIIISILIAISIAVNPFCVVFNVNASAIDPVTSYAISQALYDFFIGLMTSIGGSIAGGLLEEIDQTLHNNSLTHYEEIMAPIESGTNPLIFESRYSDADRQTLIEQGRLLESEYPAVARIDETCALSAEQLAFYESFCQAFNESGVVATESFTSGYVPTVSASDYSAIKNKVTNAFISQAYEELNASLNNGELPEYSFDFVGPLPYMKFPSGTSVGILEKMGFKYSLPVKSSNLNSDGYFTNAAACVQLFEAFYPDITVDWVTQRTDGSYYMHNLFNDFGYATSIAVFYNNDVYYAEVAKYLGYTQSSHTFYYYFPYDAIFNNARNANGECLADTGITASSDFSFSYCINMTGEVAASSPVSKVSLDDFSTTTGGGTVEIPLTPAEQVISNALKLGLLDDDSMLTIGEDGAITAADGIDLATIETLLEKIANGQLEFEDIQQYLDLITQLIGAGNLTESEQKTLLGNIEKLTQAQAKDISEIKDLIKSMTDEAEKEIVIDNELELEAPDVTIIDRFPFCLPFDLYRIFSLLCAEPKEPVFEIPINVNIGTGGLNFEIDEKIVLDLTIFRLHGYDMVRIFANSTSILIFIICLIAGTKKFIWK